MKITPIDLAMTIMWSIFTGYCACLCAQNIIKRKIERQTKLQEQMEFLKRLDRIVTFSLEWKDEYIDYREYKLVTHGIAYYKQHECTHLSRISNNVTLIFDVDLPKKYEIYFKEQLVYSHGK